MYLTRHRKQATQHVIIMETSPLVTSPQSEPDQDNSSLQNPSTNPAEAGTTDETRDEDHETSSIEALNWSEVEEEELAAAQQAEALITQGKSSTGGNGTATTVQPKAENDDEIATNNDSSTNGSTVLVNEEGNVLSTSLLQSINSTVSDEDPQARKLSVIENWASEVTNAVERGEIELTEDFPDEQGATGDDENEGEGTAQKTNGVRKRKGNKLSPEMVSSMMSSASNGESSVDPLSNAPVLDDGPIWNKGPRSYTFHENRRINQKLTFCLLIAVVLAIGLGLGNLVAHQECEAEYKASQQTQSKPADKVSDPTATPTPPPLELQERTTSHNYESSSSLPNRETFASDEAGINEDNYAATFRRSEIAPEKSQKPQPSQVQKNGEGSYVEPTIDPKYKVHAETLSRVVNTLDQLSRKIDQFENTTRKLQGVLVIPDEPQTTTEAPTPSNLFDEEVRRDDDGIFSDETTQDDEDEEIEIENLIDAIEQTPNYLVMQKTLRRIQETMKYQPRSKLMARKTPRSSEEKQQLDIIIKSVQELKDFERRFVQSERRRLKDEGKLNIDSWRTPEQYTTEEKKAVGTRYKTALEAFHKLLENKTPSPIDTLFGEEREEDQDERLVDDYSWSDIQDSLAEDGYQMKFDKDLEEVFGSNEYSEGKNEDVNIPETATEEADLLSDLESETTLESTDDLIVLEQIKETLAKANQILSSEINSATEDNNDEKRENGKSVEKRRDGMDAHSSEMKQPDINNNGRNKRSPSRDKKSSSSREHANNGNGRTDTQGNHKGNGMRGNKNDKSTKVKYEQEEFSSSRETRTQQKQEFNTNYGDRYLHQTNGNHNRANGKKSKNSQNKEKERSRERQSSWGN
ncbi:unnamed protein product [Orchesella dallaii]|uniref:Uncharacterized protein n=1 Tax=Orchesella dallaii TaxID=48710 RepID=A0ABP1RWU6_9HEXA